METNQHKGHVHVDVTDSEVGQLNAADTIEQHYHIAYPASERPSLADLDRAYQTSQEAVRVAKFWSAVYSLIWVAVTMAIWMCMPKSLPANAGPIDHLIYLIILASVPLAVRTFLPSELKERRDEWQHVIKEETKSLAEFRRLIALEKARLKLFGRT
ncbi:hypothetical protein [Xanthomonas hortorum]|uniref:hypothetical protein n=1 Tax=Xanthomonas hortorum TaxID=56454 RepID=UPI002935FA28|nr:hypothetical protein [Xanthomonas hortorum]MDV2451171.1 hypothetical protein [Xanthomonas hortorum NBC5720]